MSLLSELGNHDAVAALGWALLHFLWQGAVIAALYLPLRRALRRNDPRLRLALGHLALLALAAAPVLTVMLALREPALVAAPQVFESLTVTAGAPAAQDAVGLMARLESWLPLIVAAWALGVLSLSARAIWEWQRLRRLAADAAPVAAEWQQRLSALARRFRLRTTVALRETSRIASPLLVGFFKPVIIIPAGLLLRLPTEQTALLLAHELAHVRRLDVLANWLQLALETVLFYHPAVHWVARAVREDREQCCDDLVTSVCGDRFGYARALLALAEDGLRPPAGAFGLAATGGVLMTRIERIVGAEDHRHQSAGASWLLLLPLLLATLLLQLRIGGDRTVLDALPSLVPQRSPLALAPVAIADIAQRIVPPRLMLPESTLDIPVPESAAVAEPTVIEPAVQTEPLVISPHSEMPSRQEITTLDAPAPTAVALPVPVASDPAPALVRATALEPLRSVRPDYPRGARLRGAQGQVVLGYSVTPGGRVVGIEIQSAEPAGLFDAAARRALAQWRYPATAAGAQGLRVAFDFRLGGDGLPADDERGCITPTGTRICRPTGQ